jgi:hypothetical protein
MKLTNMSYDELLKFLGKSHQKKLVSNTTIRTDGFDNEILIIRVHDNDLIKLFKDGSFILDMKNQSALIKRRMEQFLPKNITYRTSYGANILDGGGFATRFNSFVAFLSKEISEKYNLLSEENDQTVLLKKSVD